MAFIYEGKRYRSKKFPILEYIFDNCTEHRTTGMTENHTFTLDDIAEGYRVLNIYRAASISNTILDLTRKDGGIESRLPLSIKEHGYDLRKKTGTDPYGKSFAGEFVYVGKGNALSSWYLWTETPDRQVCVQNKIPIKVAKFLSNDEGALFSVIDYCDVLSLALYNSPGSVIRVQNPMKWQPNEIDGLYFSDFEGSDTLYPTEAKALSTGDNINLEQMLGAYNTMKEKIPNVKVIPLGIQMIKNGMRIGVFRKESGVLEIDQYIQVTFEPPIKSWQRSLVRQKDTSNNYMLSLFSEDLP
jgi:hypothetical protein